uniref:Uncharacterized protein n=1 Tax=Anguilla anguilla TaxID=7936 RepID=A0A0E9QAH4_ANGAN
MSSQSRYRQHLQ